MGVVLPPEAKTIATDLMHYFLSKGCQVVFLLPRKASEVYLKITEDIMASPMVASCQRKLLSQCLQHNEFRHLAMDATVRLAMRIKGQASYRTPKEVRESYPAGDAEAKRRVLTLRGRTGAVLAMKPIKTEPAEDIKGFFSGCDPLGDSPAS